MKQLIIKILILFFVETTYANPIQHAVLNGDIVGVQSELDKGVDVNWKGRNEFSPLHFAAGLGHQEIAALLIRRGADVNAKDENNYTPLHYTTTEQVAKLLITNGAEVEALGYDGFTPLFFATIGGYKDNVELFLENGTNVNAKDVNGWTPLHYAANVGYKEIVELLIVKGADVNAESREKLTALHTATYGRIKEVAEFLIGKVADVNAKDTKGRTPLHHAIYYGSSGIAELLIAKGADVKAKDHGGMTPLDFATIQNQSEIADLIRTHEGGYGTIHGAASGGDIEAVREFLYSGADANAKDVLFGFTPLYPALFNMHEEVYKLLVAEGADVNIKQQNGKTILHLLIDVRLSSGFHPLEIIEWLIKNGSDVNAKDDDGLTPIFLAVMAYRKEAVQLLVNNGAYLNIISKLALWYTEETTPLDWAITIEDTNIEEDFVGIAELLRKNGAKTAEELKALIPRLEQHGRFAFSFDAKKGQVYEVQDSFDLLNWEVIKTYTGTGDSIRFDEERDHDPPQWFYRVRVVE